jgi:hypothetical protein
MNPPGMLRTFDKLSVLAVAAGIAPGIGPPGRKAEGGGDLKLDCDPLDCAKTMGGLRLSGNIASGSESVEPEEPLRIRPVFPKPPGGPGRGKGGIAASGGPPLGRPEMPNPFGPRDPSRLPMSSLVREGDRLSAPRPAVFGRLPNESGVLSRGGPRFDMEADGVIWRGGRICSRLCARMTSRGASDEYMLPGGGVEDCAVGALCEKNDAWFEVAVGGLFLGGGSSGNCGEDMAASLEGIFGLPGLNGGICGAGPGDPPDGLRSWPLPPSICSTSLGGNPISSGTLPCVYFL